LFEIIFYETENNTKPVEEFLDSLDIKMRRKALQEIQLLKECGNTLKEPYSKHITDGLFELRIKQSSNISRIFYFFYVGKKIVLTHGFIKKTQKTPSAEIQKGLKYKQDFERRF
jgi:phage-related protein